MPKPPAHSSKKQDSRRSRAGLVSGLGFSHARNRRTIFRKNKARGAAAPVLYQGLASAMPKPPAHLSRNKVRGEAAIEPRETIASAKRPVDEEEE